MLNLKCSGSGLCIVNRLDNGGFPVGNMDSAVGICLDRVWTLGMDRYRIRVQLISQRALLTFLKLL